MKKSNSPLSLSLWAVVTIVLLFSNHSGAQTFGKDFPTATREKVLADLNMVASIAASNTSPLHQQIFGPVEGSNYLNWFNTRVLNVEFDSAMNSGAVAYVSIFFPSTMFVTKYFTETDMPQMARLMVVYHEARHTEAQRWSHAICPVPFLDENGREKKSILTGLPLAGEAACDVTPFGAYGAALIMLKNISKFCANCNGKTKMDASIYADDQVGRMIDANAIQRIRQDLYAEQP